MFCACDVALTVFSAVVAGNLKQDPAAALKKEWVAELVARYPRWCPLVFGQLAGHAGAWMRLLLCIVTVKKIIKPKGHGRGLFTWPFGLVIIV